MGSQYDEILTRVRDFVESSFSDCYELFDLTFKPANKTMLLEVFIDSPAGITVQDCEKVSRALSDYLDEKDFIHCPYILEVSSPGVERVFKRQVDFERNVGKLVKWSLINAETGRKEVFRARLQEFSPEKIIVRTEKGLREFPLSEVKEARGVLEFPPKMKRG
ncbi:MAG: ribosome maturation factor RimP [Candidatus Rifleibacteriota bacterium]